ncbi:MAG: ABC transporter ATP-binding protein [Bowdeniella nasicola]|nr:ABC transporter ATP-binding protein [Bowdeniella nasicola]
MGNLAAITPVADPVVSVEHVSKVFGKRGNRVTALDDVSIAMARHQFTAIMGPSGSGKSTLMHCAAGLDSVTSGAITIDGTCITELSQRQLTKMRRDNIGFVFQTFNLIPTLTAKENIELPATIAHRKLDRDHVNTVVEALDLADRLTHKPAELSGGQQQRVAAARALVQRPAVLFADEPTGNLDSHASTQVLQYLRAAVDDFGQSVVMVTHEPDAAAWADRVVFLKDGRAVAQLDNPNRATVLAALAELADLDAKDQVG